MKNKIQRLMLYTFFCVGLLLVSVTGTKAQWTVHINSDTSPTTIKQTQDIAQQTVLQSTQLTTQKTSQLQQLAEYGREADRWMEKIRQHTQIINDNLKRFTTLKGIMKMAESQLGLSEDTLKALKDVGDLVRGAFTLKNNFVSLVQSRLRMIENLERRARSGIFDPKADLADLEDYLKNCIGKEAERTIMTREKIAKTDPIMEKLTNDLLLIRAERIAKEKKLKELQEQLSEEMSLRASSRDTQINDDGSSNTDYSQRVSLSTEATQTLIIQIGQIEQHIIDLKKREDDISDEIRKRMEAYNVGYDKAYYTAIQWEKTMDAWNKMNQTKIEQIDNLITVAAENAEKK